MSDSVRPHRRQPTRLPRPWDSPGKNTGVGCHFLLQYIKVKSESEVAQSCLTPSDPMDCSPPSPSIHGIFQARVLEWVAIAISKLTNTKHKERLLKAAREKQQVPYKGNPMCLTAIFQQKLCRPEGNGRIYLKYWKGKICNQDYCTRQGSHSKLIEKSKDFR